MKDKIKDKIEKLLNLSMSDNEHEASLALQRALKLMNEHNITKDEVYRQNFISEVTELDFYRLPDWLMTLHSRMSWVSGCQFTWVNGNKDFNRKVKIRITGRERDVQNAFYLIKFLERELVKRLKEYKKEIDEVYTTKYKRILLKSFKIGLIETVYSNMMAEHKTFFNEQAKSTNLVCVDLESRINDAKTFLHELLKEKPKTHKSKAKYESRGLQDGVTAGEDININPAINKQDELKMLQN